LVDDEPLNRQPVQEILENIQPVITMAANSAKALELASKNCYDLILMDMQMPEMNGLEAT